MPRRWWEQDFWAWNAPVRVHVAFDERGRIRAIRSGENGRDAAMAETAEFRPVQTWTVDEPELGPTVWSNSDGSATRSA